MPPIGDEDEDLNATVTDELQDDTPDNQDDAVDLGEEGDDAPQEDADEAEEFVISLDGEDDEEGADEPDLIKKLRAENRRLAKEAAEDRRAAAPKVEKIDPGPKPTMESCDYDEAKFEAEYEAWQGRVAAAKAAETEAEQAEQRKQQAFRADVERFARHKEALKAPDFDEAEEAVAAVLTREQASALLQATDNSAKVIYALGKRPERLKALAAETNIVKFIANVVKLEGAVKVNKTRRAPPEPDTPPRGSARLAPGRDPKLEALEREADRTGDRTKIMQYRRQLREKQAGGR